MKVIKEPSFAAAYEKLLKELLYHPEFITEPRQQEIHEYMNCTLVLTNPLSCLFSNQRRSSQYKYICAELLWYLMGDNKASFISKFSKFWLQIQNRDGTVNSAYGNLIFKEKYNPVQMTQWEWAYHSLVHDKDSRQAILHFNKPWHQFTDNKDFVCTMYANFMIRGNALHMTVHMRSNDVILGLATDIPFFVILQLNMLHLLRKVYPDLQLGTYSHVVNSMHLYYRNATLVTEMLQHSFVEESLLDGAELLVNESGEPNEYIQQAYHKLNTGVWRDPEPIPRSPFEQFIANHLFKKP